MSTEVRMGASVWCSQHGALEAFVTYVDEQTATCLDEGAAHHFKGVIVASRECVALRTVGSCAALCGALSRVSAKAEQTISL